MIKPRRRYHSLYEIPPALVQDARTLRHFGVLLSWIACFLRIPSTALRYRTNQEYPRLYRKKPSTLL